MDALHDDVARMFGYISFSSGKGCFADDISVGHLRSYAKLSSPALIASFLHHYAAVHPELIEECAPYSEHLPSDFVLYRLKSYASYLDPKRLATLFDSLRAKKA